MYKKLAKKIIALSLAAVFASVFLLGCGISDAPKGPGSQDPYRTVTFDTGVAGLEIEPIVARPGDSVAAPEEPKREGYNFGGWLLGGQAYAFSTMPSANITLTAKWNQIFTITFNSSGGSPVEPIVAAETERITAPADPVRENFKFDGWLMGEEKFFFTAMPSGNLTLTAKWLGAVTVTFDANAPGVTAPAPVSAVSGSPVSAPPAPSNPGFYLTGWLLDGVPYVFTVMPETNITLVASWVTGVTISFETNVAGVTVAPLSGPPGGAVSKPKDPVNPGYVLVGWYLDLAGDAYKFSTFPASDITLKAKWTLGSVISFDTGIAGLKVPDLVQIPGASISAPSAPPYAGHILEGWYNGATHYVFNVMPSSNLTLTAKWAVSSKLPAISVTLQEASGVPIPSADPRFRTKEYLPCVYTVAGGATGEKMQSVTGLIRAKGNGSFRENPEQRRPYRIKLDKKQSLFGWPKSKQYTLVSASHNSSDDSRLVAYSAFELARDVLALEYAVRSQPIDLFINGVYRGVYLFTETVKVEEGRLEIESEPAGIHAGTSADPYLTDTGYLLYYGNGAHTGYGTPTFARFTLQGGGNGFYIKSPDEDDVADAEIPASTRKGYDAQLAFIRAETQKLVDYMEAGNFSGFSGISDVASWVDGYIIQELYGNTDVHNGGFYLYKKSAEQGGKWYAGPPWDMDATVRSATSGIKVGNNNNRFLVAMYKMPAYMALVKARWKEISPQIKTCLTAKFNFFINDSGYQSAFIRGAGAGDTTATQSGNWKSNAEDKRDWLLSRCNWLDGEWG